MRIWRYLFSLMAVSVIYGFLLTPLRMRPLPPDADFAAMAEYTMWTFFGALYHLVYLAPWVIFYHAMTSLPFLVYINRKGVDAVWRSAGVGIISAFPMFFTPIALLGVPVVFTLGSAVGWLNGPPKVSRTNPA